MVKLEVFTFSFERLGMVEKYNSLQYEQKFQDVGTFQLVCPSISENISLLAKNRFLWIEDEVAGIIQNIAKEDDDEAKITVKGKLISAILDWRWVYPCFVKTASPISIMESIVVEHCINPSDALRKIPSLVVGMDDVGVKQSITFQKTGGSVLEAEKKIAEANDLGFDVRFNPRNENKLKFVVLQGNNRTISNPDGNDAVVFSKSLNNIVKSSYTYDDSEYCNVELVAGEAIDKDQSENDNANRKTLEVFRYSNIISGFERREMFIDARDLQSTYSGSSDSGAEKTMTDDEYNATLNQRGNEKFSEYEVKESYSGDVRTDAKTMFKYKEDYQLGDVVTIVDEDLNIAVNTVVTAMSITYDKTGYTYTPTFGNELPTILDKIERK